MSNLLFGKSAPSRIEEGSVKPFGTVVLPVDAFQDRWMVSDDGPTSKKQIDVLWNLATGESSKLSQLFVPLVL